MKKILFFILLVPTLLFSQTYDWSPFGSQILEESSSNPEFGDANAISDDGTVIVLGDQRAQDPNGDVTGHVRVFEYLTSSGWTQIGSDIDGEGTDEHFGISVAISGNGSIIAAGAPYHNNDKGHVKIYENISGTWTQIGSEIEGPNNNNKFGISVSLSNDGSIVAIGSHENSSGQATGTVTVYQNISGTWTQIGSDIDGDSNGDKFGQAISLNSAGSIIAIGASQEDNSGGSGGYARVFENISGTWTQVGSDLTATNSGDRMGGYHGVSLNAAGDVLALGATRNDDVGSDAGHVRVFEYSISSGWTQLGSTINGDAADDYFGWSVDLVHTGTGLVVSAPGNDGGGSSSGQVKVFENILGTWTQIGSSVHGASGDGITKSVTVSGDASTFAYGSITGGYVQPMRYLSIGCTDPAACNYDANAVSDDGTCILSNCVTNITQDTYHSSIQLAVDNSTNGDTLIMDSGTYTENVIINSSSIVLASKYLTTGDNTYIDATIIDANNSGSAIEISNSALNITLIGLIMKNGYLSSTNANGSALYINNANSVNLDRISIISSTAQLGGGICWQSSNGGNLTIKSSFIDNNNASDGGGIFVSDLDRFEIYNSIISNNVATVDGGGINTRSDTSIIVNSTIVNNEAGAGRYAAGIWLGGSNFVHHVLINSIFYGNYRFGDTYQSNVHLSQGSVYAYNNYNNGTFGFSLVEDQNNVGLNTSPFVDISNNDFSLNNTSSAIGGGVNSVQVLSETITTLNFDYNNLARPTPALSSPDIGAFESIYSSSDIGCTDPLACNYNANAIIDDGSCILGNCVENITQNTYTADIQSGIDASVNGDTLIAFQGTYFENISFNLKNIVLASEFLLNSDTSYISSTIIDGNQNGRVVSIEQSSNGSGSYTDATQLVGFTIQNGYANQAYPGDNGGAIYCEQANPILSDLRIINNTSYSSGPAIYARFYSEPTIVNCYIENNSGGGGAVMSVNEAKTTIINSVISNNNTNEAVYVRHGSMEIINSIINNNSKDIHCWAADLIITNSIIGNLNNSQIDLDFGNLSITHSNLRGGLSSVNEISPSTINWGSGNIDVNPLFLDTANGDYRLSNFSTCIGAGLDTSIVPTTDLDGNLRPNPAGSNPDIGAYENSLATADILGCMDPTSLTYNPNANISDPTLCCYVGGCIDPAATNYDPNACLNTITCNFIINNITQDTGYAVIQTAIDASVNGDTIIVSSGTYTENINFNGKSIVLASDFLLTGDTSYISSTIIDGNQNGTVVTIKNDEGKGSEVCKIVGFTITNGSGTQGYGGGFWIEDVYVTLDNLIIRDNYSTANFIDQGSAIYCINNSQVIFTNLEVFNNSTFWRVIMIYNLCSGYLENINMYNNTNGHFDGVLSVGSYSTVFGKNISILNNTDKGLQVGNNSSVYLINSTISDNNHYGIDVNAGKLYLLNSIVSNNQEFDGTEIRIVTWGELNSYYSYVPNYNSVTSPNWMVGYYNLNSGNIISSSNDSLFVDIANNNASLANISIAIGAGNDTILSPVDYNGNIFSQPFFSQFNLTQIPITDLDGNLRPNPTGSNPDMGAYENSLATPDILGCMDPTSLIYNPNANINDSSLCCYVSGCMDILANNYDPLACFSNSSCTYDINNITQGNGYGIIQTALDSSVNGDTIIINAGTYAENLTITTNIVLASQHLLTNDTSYISSTIIDGNQAGRVIRITENQQNIYDLDSLKITIDGLTIQNGDQYENGGGIYLFNSQDNNNWPEKHNIVLSNLNLKNNSTQSNGGAISIIASNCSLKNLSVSNNTATGYYGAIHLKLLGKAIVENCNIFNNSSSYYAGGLGIENLDTIYVNSSNIYNNTSEDYGGGAYYANSDVMKIESTNIYNNTSNNTGGGGVFVTGGDKIEILNSTISQNNCETSAGGLGIDYTDSIIINSTNFIGNESENNYGAIFLNNIGIDYINISNCDIVGNKATSKGGVFVGNGDHVVINNCRIDSNIADGGSQAGISINNNEKVEILNTKVRYNNSDGSEAGIYINEVDSLFIENTSIKENISSSVCGGIYITNNIDYAKLTSTDIVGNEGNVGGISCGSEYLVMDNCRLDSNISSGSGGGGFITSKYVTISNNQITFNQASDYAALYIDSDEFILRNSTVANNTDNSPYVASLGFASGNNNNYLIFNSIIFESTHPNRDIYMSGGNLSLYNNLLYHTYLAGYNGILPIVDSNNVFSTIDPFVDPQNGDYSLVDSSLAIGAGIDSVVFLTNTIYSSSTDRANISRPTPINSSPDIGAYENLRAVPMILGCMDTLAFNFNSLANENDSSLCCYLSGCIDPVALNYDSVPCFNDGSCIYDVTNITQNTGSNVIQTVVDLANDGDTIIIGPGTYIENVNIVDKSIHIASKYLTTGDSSYISSTIIDGNNTGSAIWIHESSNQGQYTTNLYTQDVSVTGLKLINGSDGGSNNFGGGISVKWCKSVTIDRLEVSNSSGTSGGGMSLASTAFIRISNSHIHHNSSSSSAGGIQTFESYGYVDRLEITNTLVNDNTGGNSGGGIVTDSDTLIIANSTIANNTGGHETGGVHIRSGNNHSLLYNNIVSNNINPISNNQISCNSNQNNEYLYNNYYNAVGGSPLIDFENVISQIDPFVNSSSGDFNLNDSNLAIGAGADSVYFLGDYYYSTVLDYNNKNRPTPTNSSPDIGAFENDRAQPFYVKTYVPDDVFEFYLEGQGWGDGIAFNDSVLTENIQFLTYLDVYGIGISDMTGIEDFISLIELYCYRNTISSIDLSSNVLLTKLVIAENDLSSLDLSNNPLLTHLEAHDNFLDSLDLSNQSSLTYLRLWNNPTLSFLDLRNGATNPMDLYATNNPNLYCIDVDNPFLAGLMWTSANGSIDPWASFSTNCFADLGCTDSAACNYNPNATIDDNSCFYGNCVENITQNTFTPDIQSGIDASINGDTLIASQGTYIENIIYNGKNIVIASDFFLTGDTSLISSTILDGNANGSPVVRFENAETNDAKLIGFTIQNGFTAINEQGAGIDLRYDAQPTLEHLIIENNNSQSGRGGGISCYYTWNGSNNKVILSDLIIRNNICSDIGGGIYAFQSQLSINNCKIYGNSAHSGAAIGGQGPFESITNCEFYDNIGVLDVMIGEFDLINCSFVDNHATDPNNLTDLAFQGTSSITNTIISSGHRIDVGGLLNISYSLIEDSLSNISYPFSNALVWGPGNITTIPAFNDTSVNDFSLSNFSQCIGTGTITGAPTTDILGNPRPNPSGSNPDMGAYEHVLGTYDILGCMDTLATNFDPTANINDSSLCTYCYVVADLGLDSIVACDSMVLTTPVSIVSTYSWQTTNYTGLGSTSETVNLTGWNYLTVTDSLGCVASDSIYTTINYSTASSETTTSCDSYLWNGLTYTTSGTYTWIGVNAVGCDSIVNLYLTINYSNSSLETTTVCDSYLWNGVTYDSTGSYSALFTNVDGCDSTANLALTVYYSNSSLETTTVCDSYLWNGVT